MSAKIRLHHQVHHIRMYCIWPDLAQFERRRRRKAIKGKADRSLNSIKFHSERIESYHHIGPLLM